MVGVNRMIKVIKFLLFTYLGFLIVSMAGGRMVPFEISTTIIFLIVTVIPILWLINEFLESIRRDHGG